LPQGEEGMKGVFWEGLAGISAPTATPCWNLCNAAVSAAVLRASRPRRGQDALPRSAGQDAGGTRAPLRALRTPWFHAQPPITEGLRSGVTSPLRVELNAENAENGEDRRLAALRSLRTLRFHVSARGRLGPAVTQDACRR